MKVLITGGCGFLGSNISAKYLKDKHEVIVFDSLFRKGSCDNLKWLENISNKDQFKFLQIDISDRENVKSAFRRFGPFDYICHFAGQVAMTTSIKEPYRDLMTNVVGTFNLLEACREFSPDAFFAYSSTNKVYGDLNYLTYTETKYRYLIKEFPNGFDETLNLDFSTPYGCSKGSADQYVRDWARVFNVNSVVFRHSSIYGGRQFSSFDQGWIGWFCQQALLQEKAIVKGLIPERFSIAGNGKQVRDVLHAKDLVSLYQQAYAAKETISGEVFNIGGGEENSLSLLELFSLLEEILGIDKLLFTLKDRRKSDQDVFIANISKAKEMIGWAPEISSREGILSMLKWTRSII